MLNDQPAKRPCISKDQEGCLRVSGSLNFDTIVALYQSGKQLLSHQPARVVIVIDFSEAEPKDSAALALLTAWYRDATTAQQTLRYVNVPKPVLAMAALSRLESVLPIVVSNSQY